MFLVFKGHHGVSIDFFCLFLKHFHKVEADLLLVASRKILRVQIWSLRTLWEVCQKWRNSHSKWLKWISRCWEFSKKLGLFTKSCFGYFWAVFTHIHALKWQFKTSFIEIIIFGHRECLDKFFNFLSDRIYFWKGLKKFVT